MKKLQYFFLTKLAGLYINILLIIAPKKALHLAYGFFTQPRKGKYPSNEKPSFLQNVESKQFDVANHKFLTYFWKGNNKVILLVHGWESNAARWEQLVAELQKTGATILAIEAPAHGNSSGKEFNIPTYSKFIDYICKQFKVTDIVGHSLGGASCVYYQNFYQNSDIKKIVLLGAPSDLRILLENFTKLLSIHPKIFNYFEAHYQNHFGLKIDEFSSIYFGKNIKTKGLIIHDINDDVVKIAEAYKTLSSWKNTTFIETKNLGHSMHDSSVYTKISEFLQS